MVIDTDVIIKHLRAKDKIQTTFTKTLLRYKCYTTFITEYEIYIGAKTERHLEDADAVFAVLKVIENPFGAAKTAALKLNELLAKGVQVGIMDALIAGICIFHKLPLLTENIQHFNNFSGLKILDVRVL